MELRACANLPMGDWAPENLWSYGRLGPRGPLVPREIGPQRTFGPMGDWTPEDFIDQLRNLNPSDTYEKVYGTIGPMGHLDQLDIWHNDGKFGPMGHLFP